MAMGPLPLDCRAWFGEEIVDSLPRVSLAHQNDGGILKKAADPVPVRGSQKIDAIYRFYEILT